MVPSAQVMPLAGPSGITPAIPVVANSLMSPLISYTILTLFLLAIIWIVGKKVWNSWKKIIPSILLTGTIFYRLRAYPRPGYMIGGWKRSSRDQIEYRN